MLARFSSKGLLVAVVLGLAVMALALMAQGTAPTARADPPTPFPQPGDGDYSIPVTTVAEVSGTGTGAAPIVNYKWENVDMVRLPGGTFNYFDGAGKADDDPATTGLQFWPWLADNPEARQVRYWAAVDDPNGLNDIAEVYVHVYEPKDSDGDTMVDDPVVLVEKYKKVLAEVPCTDIGTYVATGPVITLKDPLKAAVQTGQLTQAEAENVVEKCYNLGKKIYMVQADVSKDQPSGDYRVEAFARDFEGNDSVAKVNCFHVISIVGLLIDFSGGVDFGKILPGVEQVVVGDGTMSAGDGAPTVQNIGNDPMYLWLKWHDMVGAKTQPMKITNFDAIFQGEKLMFTSNVERGFCEHLCANEIKKLDLSVEPQDPLYADTYTGSLDVEGAHKADPACPR